MTKEQLRAKVVYRAQELRILAFYVPDSRKVTTTGFPVLVLAGKRGVIFAELKSAGGTMRSDQTIWRYQLLVSGQRWRLYRPADWITGVIEADLQEIA
jgi:molybdopterin synthase catalytic subunit